MLTDVGQGAQVYIWPYISGYRTTFLLVENRNNREYVLLLIFIFLFFKLKIHLLTIHSSKLADKSMNGACGLSNREENEGLKWRKAAHSSILTFLPLTAISFTIFTQILGQSQCASMHSTEF